MLFGSRSLAAAVLTFQLLFSPSFARETNKRGPHTIVLPRRQVTNPDGSARVDVLLAQAKRVQSKLRRGFMAYQKNTGKKHPSANPAFLEAFSDPDPNVDIDVRSEGIRERGVGSVPLNDVDNALWYGPITVGTPREVYNVDFDTGSSDTFLPDTNCTANCDSHKRYNPGASSTARNTGKLATLRYGDGSNVTCAIYTDTVGIGGLTATNQAVGACKEYSPGFAPKDFPPDGLVGMAFPEIAVFRSSPLFHTLITQRQTTYPVFGFALTATKGELVVGGVNPRRISGSPSFAPVNPVGFWQIAFGSIAVDGKGIVGRGSAIVDTGTSLLIGRKENVAKIYQAIPGSELTTLGGANFFIYGFPCPLAPKISVTVANRAFPIKKELFNLGTYNGGSGPGCVGGIAAAELPTGIDWILGDVFMGGVYTTFDVGSKRVGFSDLLA